MSMSRFGKVFAAVCVVLAVLLLARFISIVVSGALFAVALVACGVLAARSSRTARR